MTKLTKKFLGYVSVDSGQILIVDPCYLNEWKDGESEDKTSHYGRCCQLTLGPIKGGELIVAGTAGTAVVSTTFDGDGAYPVYAMQDENGLPTKLIIELT